VFIASPEEEPYGTEFLKVADKHFALPHRAFSFGALFELIQFLKVNSIAVVHSHGRGAGVYSRLLKFFGFKVFHTFHGIHQDPSFMGKVKFWLDRVLNPLTDGFVFVSQSEKDEAERVGFSFSKPNVVIAPLAPPCWIEFPKTYSHPIKVGSISRFDHQKGIDLLFANLSQFAKQNPSLEWTFELAGGGPLQFIVPENIRDRVKMIGVIREPIEFLRTLDIYVANSRWESFNISVIEALSQGLPLLISNVAGHEYFIKNRVAIGFEAQDAAQFSNKLKLLMSGAKPRDQFEWVRKYHSKMNVSGLYLRLSGRGMV